MIGGRPEELHVLSIERAAQRAFIRVIIEEFTVRLLSFLGDDLPGQFLKHLRGVQDFREFG